MPTYSGSGTEPLGSDPKRVDHGDQRDSPSYKGKDAGGDNTGDSTTLSSPGKSSPAGQGSTPKGVQHYDGEAV